MSLSLLRKLLMASSMKRTLLLNEISDFLNARIRLTSKSFKILTRFRHGSLKMFLDFFGFHA
jgi:hypothetical protein